MKPGVRERKVPDRPVREIRRRVIPALHRRFHPVGKSGTIDAFLIQMVEQYDNPFFLVNHVKKEKGVNSHSVPERFKGRTGQSPARFLRDVRLFAAILFLASGFRVEEAAQASGFLLQGRMTRAFRNRIGLNSREVRKRLVRDKWEMFRFVEILYPPCDHLSDFSHAEFLHEVEEFLRGLELDSRGDKEVF